MSDKPHGWNPQASTEKLTGEKNAESFSSRLKVYSSKAFQDQCFLLDYREDLIKHHLNRNPIDQNTGAVHPDANTQDIHNDSLDWGRPPHAGTDKSTAIYFRHAARVKGANSDTIVSEITKTDVFETLAKLKPSQMALLVPRAQIYTVRYKKVGATLDLKKPIFIEMPFHDHLRPQDIDEILTPAGGRGRAAGIKNITYEFDGKDPATTENMIKASMTILFSDFRVFSDPIRNLTNREKDFLDVAVDDDNYVPRYIDIINRVHKYVKSGSSNDAARLNPEYRQTKLVLGWAVPPENEERYNSLTSGDNLAPKWKDVIKVLNQNELHIYLEMTRYDIKYSQDGRIELKVDFRAFTEGSMENEEADILNVYHTVHGRGIDPKTEDNKRLARLKEKKAEVQKLIGAVSSGKSVDGVFKPDDPDESWWNKAWDAYMGWTPFGDIEHNITDREEVLKVLNDHVAFIDRQIDFFGLSSKVSRYKRYFEELERISLDRMLTLDWPEYTAWLGKNVDIDEFDKQTATRDQYAYARSQESRQMSQQDYQKEFPDSADRSHRSTSRPKFHLYFRDSQKQESTGVQEGLDQTIVDGAEAGGSGGFLRRSLQQMQENRRLGRQASADPDTADFVSSEEEMNKLGEQLISRDTTVLQESQGIPGTGGTLKYINFLFLGEIIDAALRTIERNYESAPGYGKTIPIKNSPPTILFGDLSFLDPRTNRQAKINIADIPISKDLLEIWFFEKVIRPGRKKYYLKDFIRDVMNDFVYSALGSGCYWGAGEQLPILNMTPLIMNKKPFMSGGKIIKYHGALEGFRTKYSLNLRVPGATGGGNMISSMGRDSFDNIPVSKIRQAYSLYHPSKTTEELPTHSYILMHGTSRRRSSLDGDYRKDKLLGIPHFGLGYDRGIVKTVEFQRMKTKFLAEARIVDEDETGLMQLQERFNARVKLWGTTNFRNGQYVYIDPETLGTSVDLQKIGIGGYFVITKVRGSVKPEGFETELDCTWNGPAAKKDEPQYAAAVPYDEKAMEITT